MAELSTGSLSEVLLQTNFQDLDAYRQTYLSPLSDLTFPEYFLSVLAQHGISRSQAVAGSGLEVHYAYQILNGRKRPSRDKIICLCIGGSFSLLETNRALERALLGSLYPKRLRDAVIITALHRRIFSVWKVNELLAEHGLPLLG